jgi:hypothetical protein
MAANHARMRHNGLTGYDPKADCFGIADLPDNRHSTVEWMKRNSGAYQL